MGDYWVKLYTEILDDPKMGTLTDRQWRRVIELFLLAGKLCADKSGILPETKQLAWMLRMPADELDKDLNELTSTGIIQKIETGWLVVNFKKRQEKSDVNERVRRYRSRQQRNEYYGGYETQSQNNVTDNVTQMKRNVTSDSNADVTQMKRNVTSDSNADVTQMKRNVTQINRLTDNRLTDNRLTETESESETESETDVNNGDFSKNLAENSYFSESMKPLIEAFCKSTGLYPPVGGGFITKKWHDAMLELLNQKATPEEITATIQDMTERNYRIAGPWSIINGISVHRSKEHAKKRFVTYKDENGNIVEVEV
ncbi:MAG: hypothetical protein KatS3mg054_0622 [Chloroflexus sp.]|nr:MAG: hypothetical protein KatS3mg054_0622 [Chloroflexus sp.]